MKGLIIRSPWIEKILNGEKTWEIRGSNTKIRGKIALIRSGSGIVVGTCDLVDSFPLNKNDLENNRDKHQISDISSVRYKRPHAWVLSNVKKLDKPKPYKHPQGAVIWVNLKKI